MDTKTHRAKVRILRRLDHPNVVSIYEFYEEDPAYYYVVLEFMAGGDILDHVASKVWMYA